MSTIKIHCKYDELVGPKSLKDHPKNRNKHDKDQIERLAKLYEYHGIRHPIIVSSRSGCIVAGHGRKAAAIKAGLKEMPVVYQSFDTDEAEYAFIQADNAIALWAELDLSGINDDIGDLGPDFDIDLLGIKNFTVDVADKEFEADEDEVPEARPEPKVVRGEVYILENHRLMCGDSTAITDVEKLMNGEKADMVFTDPPYILSKSGGGMADDRPNWKKYQDNGLADFDPTGFISILTLLNVPTLYVFCSKDLLKAYIEYFENTKRSWNLLVMQKNNPIPMKNNTFLSDTEWMFFSRGDGATFNNDLEYDRYRKVFSVSVKTSEFGHPTEKQVKIIEPYIEISSKKGMLVLDLFGGSGSTLIACEKTDRQCFMMELDPIYCGVILDRWQKFTGKKAHREDGIAWDEIKGGE